MILGYWLYRVDVIDVDAHLNPVRVVLHEQNNPIYAFKFRDDNQLKDTIYRV